MSPHPPFAALSAAVCAATLLATGANLRADEGMWTYDAFPSAAVKAKYGFAPTQTFLDHLRLSSAKVGGCSSSFVSKDGLVMTNHHCAHRCIAQLSTAKKDYIAAGFTAKTLADEVKCPDLEVARLEATVDVSARMQSATKGLSGPAFADARNAEMSAIEKECGTGNDVRCDVITLFSGGKYVLYKYRRWQDVRLAFAPELASAFFGGDPDNFEFPRYDLDVSFLRIYENGKPAHVDHFLQWAKQPVKDGDLAFVSGTPFRTNRLRTIAELETIRDLVLPERLLYAEELRGWLTQFMERGPEARRIATAHLFGVENDIKRNRGRFQTLVDKTFFAKKQRDELELMAKVNADPAKKAAYGDAWAEIAKAEQTLRALYDEYVFLEGDRHGVYGTAGFRSDLFAIARALVRGADERPKADGKRLREFADSGLAALQQELFSDAPIYPELEQMELTFSLTKLREQLGPDHPAVKKLFGKDSPKTIAWRLVTHSKLADLGVRRALWDGGKKAIDASTDPMIAFARLVDADARALRTRYDGQVEGPEAKHGGRIARARFEAYGDEVYPDATHTLRLSYGKVEGWKENGKTVPAITTFGGAFERHTGEEPFALPKSWLDAKGKLDLKAPLDFVTSNDIVGGNSGSPVVGRDGAVIGLAFDGNFPATGNDFGFDAAKSRTVSVAASALIEALGKIYGATRIADELLGK